MCYKFTWLPILVLGILMTRTNASALYMVTALYIQSKFPRLWMALFYIIIYSFEKSHLKQPRNLYRIYRYLPYSYGLFFPVSLSTKWKYYSNLKIIIGGCNYLDLFQQQPPKKITHKITTIQQMFLSQNRVQMEITQQLR